MEPIELVQQQQQQVQKIEAEDLSNRWSLVLKNSQRNSRVFLEPEKAKYPMIIDRNTLPLKSNLQIKWQKQTIEEHFQYLY